MVVGIIVVALVVVYLWHRNSKHRQPINPEESIFHTVSFERSYDATELRGVASDPIVKLSVAF